MKLSGVNFQSWPKFQIDIEGLTCVVGPSDLGKSSLYRSLKAVTRNNLPAGWTRTGTTRSSVKLEDGITVELSRNQKSSTKYEINGEEFSKLQGGVPPEIAALGFGTIDLGDNTYDPIFAGQFDDQFGVTWTPAKINQILGAFASTERLELGKKEVNKRVASINSESKVIAEELNEVTKSLIVMRNLSSDGTKATSAMEALEERVEVLGGQTRSSLALLSLSDTLKPYLALEGMKLDLDLDTVQDLADNVQDLDSLVETQARRSLVLSAIKGLTIPQGIDPSIQDKITAIDKLLELVRKLKQFPDVQAIPESDLNELEGKINLLERACTLRDGLRSAEGDIEQLDQKILQATEELQELNKSSEIKECPSCGHKWSENE